MTDNDNINGNTKTTVVNLHKESYDVYIGRAGRGEKGSFGNPFSMKQFGREGCIKKFEEYFLNRVRDDLVFRDKVLKLRGKKLGCFCAPRRCHGEIIVAWLEQQDEELIARGRAEGSRPKPEAVNTAKKFHLKALAMKMTPEPIVTSMITPEEKEHQLNQDKERIQMAAQTRTGGNLYD